MNEIDAYIASFPEQVSKKLEEMRAIIRGVVPEAQEVISYQMPAYKQNGIVVYFGGFKNHVGLYPTASGIRNFEKEFGPYKWSKGAVQFSLDQPLPKDLIEKIVKFRAKEDMEKGKKKKY